ncbi:MAG: CDP-alcohol phosphatidyltransferase family protein [Alphaproteobacteria bacterium]|nr:CDP-alcohol phosphatidyltransferase family protein [Alphaproteobacteria bacterium]
MTLPNLLSGLRIALVPVLLALAWMGQSSAFVVTFAVAAATDALDGYLARRLRQVTELGARLDSIGDIALYFSLPLAAWWLWPDLVRAEAVWVVAAAGSVGFAIVVGFVRFGRLPSHHTWAAKTVTALLPFACVALLLGYPTAFHLAMAAMVAVAIEELAITLILPRWTTPVPTLLRALALRKEAQRVAPEAR